MSINAASKVNAFQSMLSQTAQASAAGKTGSTSKASTGKDQFVPSPSLTMLQQLLSQNMDGSDDSKETGLSGFELLKQRTEMLSNMIQMKLKNFESNLVSSVKSAGLDPSQQMNVQNGVDGLLLSNDMPNKDAIQNLLGNSDALLDQFKDISQLAGLLGTLQQTAQTGGAGSSAASQYAQQSQALKATMKPDAQLTVRVAEGNASFTFD